MPTTITLPVKFVEDHAARGLPVGRVTHLGQREVTLVLDRQSWLDLHSDADYYASFTGYDFQENRGVVLSARAVLRRMNAVEAPQATAIGRCPTCRENLYDDNAAVCSYCQATGYLEVS